MDEPIRHSHAARRPLARGLAYLVAGCFLLILFKLLKALDVGTVGAPSDIGGGVIPLTGYFLVAAGFVKIAAAARARWWSR